MQVRFLILVFIAACTPATTRPPFMPYPATPALVINARPARVIAALDSLVAAESLRVTVASQRDGYLETAWYDTAAKTSHATRGDVANLATSRRPVIMSRSQATATTARGRRSRITRRASWPRVATNTGTS